MNYFFNALTKIDVFIVIFTKNIVYILISMKNTVLSVLFTLLFVSVSNAEEVKVSTPEVLTADTIWLNQKQKVCDKDTASYCRVVNTNQALDFVVNDYYLTGELYMTGKFSSLKPENREGEFVWYYKNGQKKKSQTFENGTSVKSKYWDIEGNESKPPVDPTEKMPQFPKGDRALMEFIVSNLRYPKDASTFRIQGRVLVKFTIDEFGNVVNPFIYKGVHKLLDEEALRVVNLMPKWKPGISEGEPAKVFFTIPIVFKLGPQSPVVVRQQTKFLNY